MSATACTGSSSARPYNRATVRSDVSSAYASFFNLMDKGINAKLKVTQDGASIRGTLEQVLSNPISITATGAQVDNVTVLGTSVCRQQRVPTPCARVSYLIFGPAVSGPQFDITGYATFQDGHWLVAKVTACDLLDASYKDIGGQGTPPGC
jgi:hypothetical protein